MNKLKRACVFPLIAGLLLQGTGCTSTHPEVRAQSPEQEIPALDPPAPVKPKPKKKFELPRVRMTWRDRKKLERVKDAFHDKTVAAVAVVAGVVVVSGIAYSLVKDPLGSVNQLLNPNDPPVYAGPDASPAQSPPRSRHR